MITLNKVLKNLNPLYKIYNQELMKIRICVMQLCIALLMYLSLVYLHIKLNNEFEFIHALIKIFLVGYLIIFFICFITCCVSYDACIKPELITNHKTFINVILPHIPIVYLVFSIERISYINKILNYKKYSDLLVPLHNLCLVSSMSYDNNNPNSVNENCVEWLKNIGAITEYCYTFKKFTVKYYTDILSKLETEINNLEGE